MTGIFYRNIQCSILWIPWNQPVWFQTRDYHALRWSVPGHLFSPNRLYQSPNPTSLACYHTRFGLPSADFDRLYYPHLITMSFPAGTRMLRFPACPFLVGTIRRSRDQPLLAGPPCFSQLATSFLGSQTKPFTNRLLD